MRIPFIPLCLAASVLLTACGQHHKKKKSPSRAEVYYIHGDPDELIAGTELHQSGLTSLSELQSLDGFSLRGINVFREATDRKSVETIETQEELEEQNSTEDEDDSPFVSAYKFEPTDSGFQYYDPRPEAASYPRIAFELQDNQLVMTSIDQYPVEAIHYSVRNDGRAFSILFKTKDISGENLVAIYFIRPSFQLVPPKKVDAPENYFLDGNLVSPWSEPINISLCGSSAKTYGSETQEAMQDWSEAGGYERGKIGELSYTISAPEKSRPFSDLNQNCVRYVDVYRAEDQERIAQMGLAVTIIDPFRQEILNSSIFIFQPAVRRTGASRLAVLTHELGHLLGLGHAFSQDPSKPAPDSIMGYSGIESITSADRKAIRYLYPPTAVEVDRVLTGGQARSNSVLRRTTTRSAINLRPSNPGANTRL
jgi:hypothetical protein